ncbi:MAG: helix-turn-helix domain containing protein [Candidatus Diapherotrites archaeon]
MIHFQDQTSFLQGPAGTLEFPVEDEITLKFAMLYEGECEGLGATAAAQKFGYSKQRYFQLLHLFREQGAAALLSQKRGPRTHYRRTESVVRQVIRHRFLDPDASAAVIAQKLHQTGATISLRSVERILAEYGLQKKTPCVSTGSDFR